MWVSGASLSTKFCLFEENLNTFWEPLNGLFILMIIWTTDSDHKEGHSSKHNQKLYFWSLVVGCKILNIQKSKSIWHGFNNTLLCYFQYYKFMHLWLLSSFLHCLFCWCHYLYLFCVKNNDRRENAQDIRFLVWLWLKRVLPNHNFLRFLYFLPVFVLFG